MVGCYDKGSECAWWAVIQDWQLVEGQHETLKQTNKGGSKINIVPAALHMWDILIREVVTEKGAM